MYQSGRLVLADQKGLLRSRCETLSERFVYGCWADERETAPETFSNCGG